MAQLNDVLRKIRGHAKGETVELTIHELWALAQHLLRDRHTTVNVPAFIQTGRCTFEERKIKEKGR